MHAPADARLALNTEDVTASTFRFFIAAIHNFRWDIIFPLLVKMRQYPLHCFPGGHFPDSIWKIYSTGVSTTHHV
jgi:hypothetical protein